VRSISRTLLTSDVGLLLYEQSFPTQHDEESGTSPLISTGDRRVLVATKKPTGSKRRNQTKAKNIAPIEPTVSEPNPGDQESYDSTVAPKSRSFDAPAEPDWHRMISVAAYYCAEKRDFADGYALEDWLTAEAQVRSLMGS
jgi:Protein of unknown function (DUF2934)